MRQSLSTFIDTCFHIKCLLKLSSYELHDYEDGSYADFHVREIRYPKEINKAIGPLEWRIITDERGIVIRVFEDFQEY